MVVTDPMLNDRSRLLTLARDLVAADGATSAPDGASSTAGTEPT
jgi:hypothetical protein